jgi:uncharacterized protein YukE
LQANINNLKQQAQRQQELLYNAEYQIQRMERDVERKRGDRSEEEIKKLNKEIEELNEKQNLLMKDFHTLNQSNKQLIDEIRTTERQFEKVKQDKDHLGVQIQELELENEMAISDLEKV